MSHIAIDLDSKVAPFEQIKTSIIGLIIAGDLPKEHRLPTIRQLAGDLGVAPNTVARSYRELEVAGVVRSRGRRGTTIVGIPEHEQDASDPVRLAVTEARARGQSTSDILAVVMRALAAG